MPLNIERLALPDVLLLRPQVFGDARGFFMEAWNKREFDEAAGAPVEFVQDNHSRSARGVLRGLHYQLAAPQGKLVRVAVGEVFDVAVDIRRGSPTFGQHSSALLSADNKHQLWIPAGFAHGFMVVSEVAEVLYKATDYYDPSSDRSLLWNDPALGIEWPGLEPRLSDRDRDAVPLAQADLYD